MKRILFLLLAVAGLNSAKADPMVFVDHFVCTKQNDVRELFIEPRSPIGCKLWYAKASTKEIVAGSTKGLVRCEDVHQNIRKNLESSGFICKAVNDSVPK